MELTKTSTICNEVFRQIEQNILSGDLKCGDKLPTERDMAANMSLSRSSVREGLKALEIMGILESRQGGGNYITRHPENTINNTLCIMFALSEGKLDDLLQFRKVLEMEACKYIIRNRSDQELEQLETSILPPASKTGETWEMSVEFLTDYDSTFHMALLDLSDNILYKYLYQTLFVLIQQYFQGMAEVTFEKEEYEKTYEEHLAILHALKSRDEKQLEEVIEAHIRIDETYRASLPLHTRMGISI